MRTYNPFSLQGKRILVTGASSGIGRATAVECAKLGASLVLTGRDQRRLQETLSELDSTEGQQHMYIVADITADEGLSRLMEEMPLLDGVFSNAGILKGQVPVKFLKDGDIDDMIDTNLTMDEIVVFAFALLEQQEVKGIESYRLEADAEGHVDEAACQACRDFLYGGASGK